MLATIVPNVGSAARVDDLNVGQFVMKTWNT
jgi:hypothetical protein